MECKECTGTLMFLGLMGNMEHYRCRNCGLDQCQPASEDLTYCPDCDADVEVETGLRADGLANYCVDCGLLVE